MHAVNIDALSHQNRSAEKFLQMVEREKNNKKYLDSFLHQHRHFSPFFVLVGGLLGVEVEAVFKRIAIRLAMKWK